VLSDVGELRYILHRVEDVTERVASGIIGIISAPRATNRERRAYAEGD
jgi:hypothetical protein